jgi:hypothetical protein
MLSLQRSAGNRAVADLVQRHRETLPRVKSEPGSLVLPRQVDAGDNVVEDEATVPLGAGDRTDGANPLGRSIRDQRPPQTSTVLRLEATSRHAAVGSLGTRAVTERSSTGSPMPVLATARTDARERSSANVIGYKQTSRPVVQRHSITSGWFTKEVKLKLDALDADFDSPG